MADTRTAAPRPGRPRRSAVEALLEKHPGDEPLPVDPLRALTVAARHAAAADLADLAGAAPSPHQAGASAISPLPPVQDIAVGLTALLVEQAWRAADRAVGVGRSVVVRWLRLVRTVSPQVATQEVDARLDALADRGRRVRQERATALRDTLAAALLAAVTSDQVRGITVATVDTMLDDLIPVITPKMLDALREKETEAVIDEMMAGLLVRQLPDAMEKIAPIMLVRTATRPTALVPSILGGVLPRSS